MNFKSFNSVIASHLSTVAWSFEGIETALRHRMPPRLQHHAAPMAKALLRAFPKCYAPSAPALTRTLSTLPQTRVAWNYAQKHQVWPSAILTAATFTPPPPFAALGLPALSASGDLAGWLGITPEELVRFSDKKGLSNRTDNPFAPHYRYHLHEKPAGGLRLIEEPKPMLKTLQRRILAGLLNLVPPSPAAFGFTRGRDCLSAAAIHAGEDMVLCFDLRAFFPSVTHNRIHGLFRTLGYPDPVARDLTGLTTVATPPHILARARPDGADILARRHLPQGAPTSPALANLSAFNLDRRLTGLARRLDARYTRYADDMTFSGASHIAATLREAVPEIVRDESFALNPHKTRAQPRSGCQSTTGLVVNEKINIRRAEYDLLKATIHHLSHAGDPRRRDPMFLSSLDGRITWVERINPARGHKLREALAAALSR